jgi:hypothetical protein
MSDSFDHVDYFEYVQQLLGNEIRESNGPMIQTLSAEDLANVREAYHQGFYAFNSFLSNNSDQGQIG